MSSAHDTHTLPETLCPLCRTPGAQVRHRDAARVYLRCPACALIFVPARHHLTAVQEKQRYDLHRNSPQDAGYRRFLAQVFEPLAQRLPAGAAGLDYGCGPGPTLSLMFEEAGHPMRLYDPHYAADHDALRSRYHFVTCTEAAEHFARPGAEWRRIVNLVRPGGWIGVMTRLYGEATPFETWFYKNDPTHVCFYARETFGWLAEHHRLSLHILSASVILLQKT